MSKLTIIKKFDNGTQLESDGVLRTSCSYGDSTTCGDSVCNTNRAKEARKIITREATSVDSIEQVKKLIGEYDKQIKEAQQRIAYNEKEIKYYTDYRQTYTEQLQFLETVEKQKKDKQDKLREDKEAKARATIAEQIASLSPERLTDLLVEQGITQIGPRQDSARIILTEAYDTLAMSFWIKSDETRALSSYFDSPLDVPADVKAIAVKNGGGKYKAVTGMCAVGALAMSRAMLDEAPIQEWGNLVGVDRSARIAAEALAWAIWQDEQYAKEVDPTSKVTNVITYWNDQPNREKDEVLTTWNKAITECPFLDLDEESTLYRIHTEFTQLNYPFTSEAEAKASLERLKNNTPQTVWEKRVRGLYPENAIYDNLTVVEYRLPEPMVAKV